MSSPPLRLDRPLVGIGFMLLASLAFSVMTVSAKLLGRHMSAIELVLWRNAFGTLWIAGSLWRRPPLQRGGRPWLLIARGLLGTLALYGLFYNVQAIHLGTAATFPQMAPMFIAIIAHVWLGERMPRTAWWALGLGLLGVVLILRPSADLPARNGVIGVFSAACTALAYVSLRQLGAYYDTRAIVLSFTLWGLLLPACSLAAGAVLGARGFDFAVARYAGPRNSDWGLIALLSISALCGQTYVTKAYASSPAGVVSAIGYTTVVLTLGLGLWLGGGWPDAAATSGIALVVISGVLVSLTRDRTGSAAAPR